MNSRASVLIPLFAALQPAVAAAQCLYNDSPELLVPRTGAQDVVTNPLLLVATPISNGTLELDEVRADGGLQLVGSSTVLLSYTSGYRNRMTLRPTGGLNPNTTYRVSWVNPPSTPLIAGQFFTGGSTSTPAPLPLTVQHQTFRSRATSGSCESCTPWEWGTDRLTWSTDGGDTWARLRSFSGEVLAQGVSQAELAYFACTPAARLMNVAEGFVLVPDAGAQAQMVDVDFFGQSGLIVATATATLDVTCQLEVPQGCGPGPDGGGGGGNPDAGSDGGTTTPPQEGCGCPSFGSSGAIFFAFALAAAVRAAGSRRRSGS